jgi:hypothetical protein
MIDLPLRPERHDWQTAGRVAATGTPEELAALLRAYADVGISHVQVWLDPATIAGIEAFAEVLDRLDRS